MTIKQAIQKAIDNGYKVDLKIGGLDNENVIWLDPKFWEALGRAEGWGKYTGEKSTLEDRETWKDKIHRMIDALIAGKSLEEFFKEL